MIFVEGQMDAVFQRHDEGVFASGNIAKSENELYSFTRRAKTIKP